MRGALVHFRVSASDDANAGSAKAIWAGGRRGRTAILVDAAMASGSPSRAETARRHAAGAPSRPLTEKAWSLSRGTSDGPTCEPQAPSRHSSGSGGGYVFLIPAAAYLVGGAVFFRWQLFSQFDLLSGNSGDTVIFILAIHEHLFQVLHGRSTLLSPPFLYDTPGTLGYSDAFILNEALYAPLRLLGAEPFLALELVPMLLSAPACLFAFPFSAAIWRSLGGGRDRGSVAVHLPQQPVPEEIGTGAVFRRLLPSHRALLRNLSHRQCPSRTRSLLVFSAQAPGQSLRTVLCRCSPFPGFWDRFNGFRADLHRRRVGLR